MIYYGTGALERILFHDDVLEEPHWIDMEMSLEDDIFAVTCCCDDSWEWVFYYNKSDYDRVKFTIMNAIYECDDVDELLDILDEIFAEDFEDILVDEDEFECDGCCGACGIYEE